MLFLIFILIKVQFMERYQEITYNMKESLFLKVIHLNSGRLTAHKIGNINLKKYAVRFLMEDI